MNFLKLKTGRRDFIRQMSSLASLQLLNMTLGPHALMAQGASSAKRFIMIFYPNGCVRNRWHSYPNGRLSPVTLTESPLEPLADYTDNLVLFKNLSYAGHGGSSSHPDSCKAVFSGGQVDETSFDVSLGEAIGGRITNNIHLGLWSSLGNGSEYMPFTDKNQNKIISNDNPQLVFDNLFGDLVNNEEQSETTEQRKKVLIALQENLDLLQEKNLSRRQKNKLISHEEALDYYQNILESQIGDGVSITRPNIGMTGRNEDAENICKAQLSNIAMAFQANITRTASFQFMSAQDESLKINFPSIRPFMGDFGFGDKLNYNETRSHVSSHNESSLFDSQTRWYNMMIRYLLDELSQRDDNQYGGKLLDNTLILVMSEVGGGNHQQENPGVYAIGGRNVPINRRTGIDCAGAGMSNVFLDTARAFGLPWERYGNSFGGISNYLTS